MSDPNDTAEIRIPPAQRRRAQVEHRRTKIVATVGPASREPETLVELIEAGADVFRLNFSHGTPDDHAENVLRIRAAAKKTGKWVAVLGDLPGPKIRLLDIEGGRMTVHLDAEVTLTAGPADGDREEQVLPIAWDDLTAAVHVGDPIFLADGRIRLRAKSVGRREVRTVVEAGGTVGSHQGVNLPASHAGSMPAAGASDMDWVGFACSHEIDLLAVSFVRGAVDLEPVAKQIKKLGGDIPLIAKIEKPQAATNAEEIIRAAGSGIMVARGDLGIELPIETVPTLQKRLIRLAGRQQKPSITATQMLASMVSSDRPTRAEVTDVANAIYDGTDAVMLSEETAIGDHPVEAIRVMDRVARATEGDLPYGDWLLNRVHGEDDVAAAVAQGAVGATYRLGLTAIVVPTRSGRTARVVSALRPKVPILAISPRVETVRRLNLLFGVKCAYHDEWEDLREILDDSAIVARKEGVAQAGDLIAITAGLPDQGLGTNLFEVHRVPE